MIRIKHGIFAAAAIALFLPPLAAQQPQPKPQTQASGTRETDQKQIYNYTLTMDKIRRLVQTQKGLAALQNDHPGLSKSLESDNSSGNLDESTQALERSPQAVAAIRKNGFAPREYIVATMALIQAGAAADFKKSGAYSSPQIQQLVSPANLTFLEQHQPEIAKLLPTFGSGSSTGAATTR